MTGHVAAMIPITSIRQVNSSNNCRQHC